MEQKDLLVSLFKLCLNDTQSLFVEQTRGSGPQSMAPKKPTWLIQMQAKSQLAVELKIISQVGCVVLCPLSSLLY